MTDFTHMRTAILEHRRALDQLPDRAKRRRKGSISGTGSGSLIFSRAAAEQLVEIFEGSGEIRIIDRPWLHMQLERLGIAGGDVDLLLDNLPPARPLELVGGRRLSLAGKG